jgi:carbon storage regulator
MLILTRRVGEAILIDGGVRIVVLGNDGGGVRLGIEAPPAVGIIREEVLKRVSGGELEGGGHLDGRPQRPPFVGGKGAREGEDRASHPEEREEP